MMTESNPGCGMELLARVRVFILYLSHARHRFRRGGSWPGAAEHQQVIGDDPEPHPALHPALAVVPAAPEPMTALERADPAFAPRAPAERTARSAQMPTARTRSGFNFESISSSCLRP